MERMMDPVTLPTEEIVKIYYGDIGTSTIYRANPDGSSIETLIPNAQAWEMALDVAQGKIYWITLWAAVSAGQI